MTITTKILIPAKLRASPSYINPSFDPILSFSPGCSSVTPLISFILQHHLQSGFAKSIPYPPSGRPLSSLSVINHFSSTVPTVNSRCSGSFALQARKLPHLVQNQRELAGLAEYEDSVLLFVQVNSLVLLSWKCTMRVPAFFRHCVHWQVWGW